jgi:hypothetical protein
VPTRPNPSRQHWRRAARQAPARATFVRPAQPPGPRGQACGHPFFQLDGHKPPPVPLPCIGSCPEAAPARPAAAAARVRAARAAGRGRAHFRLPHSCGARAPLRSTDRAPVLFRPSHCGPFSGMGRQPAPPAGVPQTYFGHGMICEADTHFALPPHREGGAAARRCRPLRRGASLILGGARASRERFWAASGLDFTFGSQHRLHMKTRPFERCRSSMRLIHMALAPKPRCQPQHLYPSLQPRIRRSNHGCGRCLAGPTGAARAPPCRRRPRCGGGAAVRAALARPHASGLPRAPGIRSNRHFAGVSLSL